MFGKQQKGRLKDDIFPTKLYERDQPLDIQDDNFTSCNKQEYQNSKSCMNCFNQFQTGTLFNKSNSKHHCKKCGRCVCGTCSQSKINGNRVCQNCISKYVIIQNWYSKTTHTFNFNNLERNVRTQLRSLDLDSRTAKKRELLKSFILEKLISDKVIPQYYLNNPQRYELQVLLNDSISIYGKCLQFWLDYDLKIIDKLGYDNYNNNNRRKGGIKKLSNNYRGDGIHRTKIWRSDAKFSVTALKNRSKVLRSCAKKYLTKNHYNRTKAKQYLAKAKQVEAYIQSVEERMKQNVAELEQELEKILKEDDDGVNNDDDIGINIDDINDINDIDDIDDIKDDEKGRDNKNDNYKNQRKNVAMAMEIETTIGDINSKLYCTFLKNKNNAKKNTNSKDNKGDNVKLTFRCEVYDKMIKEKDFQQEYLYHMQLYDHSKCIEFKNCEYGLECEHYQRLIKNGQLIEDKCHLQIYNHPPRMNRFFSLNNNNDDDNNNDQDDAKVGGNVQSDKYFNAFQFHTSVEAIDRAIDDHANLIAELTQQPIYDAIYNMDSSGDHRFKLNPLKQLINEVCQNGYKNDLMIYNYEKNKFKYKSKMNDNNNKYDKNDNLLRILQEKLIHPKHVQFGMPFLDKKQFLFAIMLYTDCDCNYDLCQTIRNNNFTKWKLFDMCLKHGIILLHKYFINYDYHSKLCTYSGISQCQLKLNKNNACFIHFSTYVSTSLDKSIGIKFLGDKGGMLCTFDPSMMKRYYCCDVGSWISKFPHEQEVLFVRDHIELTRVTLTKQVNNVQYLSFVPHSVPKKNSLANINRRHNKSTKATKSSKSPKPIKSSNINQNTVDIAKINPSGKKMVSQKGNTNTNSNGKQLYSTIASGTVATEDNNNNNNNNDDNVDDNVDTNTSTNTSGNRNTAGTTIAIDSNYDPADESKEKNKISAMEETINGNYINYNYNYNQASVKGVAKAKSNSHNDADDRSRHLKTGTRRNYNYNVSKHNDDDMVQRNNEWIICNWCFAMHHSSNGIFLTNCNHFVGRKCFRSYVEKFRVKDKIWCPYGCCNCFISHFDFKRCLV